MVSATREEQTRYSGRALRLLAIWKLVRLEQVQIGGMPSDDFDYLYEPRSVEGCSLFARSSGTPGNFLSCSRDRRDLRVVHPCAKTNSPTMMRKPQPEESLETLTAKKQRE